jgi:hypothetical protein
VEWLLSEQLHVSLLLCVSTFVHVVHRCVSALQPLSQVLQADADVCPEWRAGLWSRLTFGWLSPLIKRGYKAPLTEADLWSLPPTDRWAPLLQTTQSTVSLALLAVLQCMLRLLLCRVRYQSYSYVGFHAGVRCGTGSMVGSVRFKQQPHLHSPVVSMG